MNMLKDTVIRALKAPLKFLPWTLGVFGGVCWMAFWPYMPHEFKSAVKLPTMYAAGFDLLTVLSGFLFAVYGLIITTNNGLLGRLRKDKTILYKHLTMALKSSTTWGIIGALFAAPLMAMQPPIEGPWLVYSGVWIGLTVGASLSFLRLVNVFYGLVDDDNA